MTNADPSDNPDASTVAVGFDGSDQARDALALGAELARLLAARLAVVTAYRNDFLVDLSLEENEATLREDAEAKLADAGGGMLDGLAVELHTPVSSSDARGLHDAAEELDADVLVVGSSHRGAAGRVLLGSVGTRLLHGAPCAVAVAPSGYAASASHDLRVIAAGFDASPESRSAVSAAVALATAAHATLRILAVADTTSVGAAVAIAWATYDDTIAAHRAFLEREVARLIDGLPSELRPDSQIPTGEPASVIVDEAAKGVGLLVLGSRGYGTLRRVMLGSVTAAMLAAAPCPVLVTPRGTRVLGGGRAPAAETTAPRAGD